jgi:hypothetical protein
MPAPTPTKMIPRDPAMATKITSGAGIGSDVMRSVMFSKRNGFIKNAKSHEHWLWIMVKYTYA